MYGQYFKRLRNYKKMTLGEAAKDITSSPALSRWENGVDDIRLKKFLALLDRVDITPREFFAYTEVQGNLDNSYYDELQLLVQQKDGQRLHQIFLRQISSFHQTKDPDMRSHLKIHRGVQSSHRCRYTPYSGSLPLSFRYLLL